MRLNSLYLAPIESLSGSLSIATGLMKILKGQYGKVAFFKPILNGTIEKDNDIKFLINYFNLDIKVQKCYCVTYDECLEYIANDKINELVELIITRYKQLEEKYDFVFTKGVVKSIFTNTLDIDINLLIAKNLNIPIISLLNGYNKSLPTIEDEIQIERLSIKNEKCQSFATFVNKIDDDKIEQYKKDTQTIDNLYLVSYEKQLSLPTLHHIKDELDCKLLYGDKSCLSTSVDGTRIVAMTLENLLSRVNKNNMLIVPADQTQMILSLILANLSQNSIDISALLLTGGFELNIEIKDLLGGIANINLPILLTNLETYETAQKIANIKTNISIEAKRTIDLGLVNFYKNFDSLDIVSKLNINKSDMMTPMMFEYSLFTQAKSNKKTIVLPEGDDERILRASEILLLRGIVNIVILGCKKTILHRAKLLGVDITKANIIDPAEFEDIEIFTTKLYELRKHKGLTLQHAKDLLVGDFNVFATMMVELSYADGMVSGAVGSTANTVRPALQIIKTKPNISLVSSIFFMCLDTKVLLYGDCALNQNPTAQELAQIALSSAQSAKAFGIDPKIAMLSYSTGDSGSGGDVDKIKEATNIVKDLDGTLCIDGPIQYDAAVSKAISKKKLPNSKVAGEANIFIFPDLNTGNNTYKAVQRSSGAVAIGPVLQGLNKPVNDLSRGCLVEDIINTVAITAIQDGEE